MYARSSRAALATVLVVAGFGRGAAAQEQRRGQPAVRLELAACLGRDFDSVLIALRAAASGTDEANTIDVLVDCMMDGLDAGLVIEVRRPDRIHSYVYALDWHAQPPEARPHLLWLAVAEAMAASRIGLIALGAARPPDEIDSTGAHAASDPPNWAVAFVGTQRSFLVNGGVALGGGGVMPSRRLSPHLRLSLDLLAEGASVALSSGSFEVLSVSSAPRITYRFGGGRLHADLGFGGRIGVVRMRGPASAASGAPPAEQVIRMWVGPTTTVTAGVELTPGVSLDAGFELGIVEGGANAHDMGLPVVVMGGAWTSFGVAASIAL